MVLDPCNAGSQKFLARDCHNNETSIWTLTGEKCFVLPDLPLAKPDIIVKQTIVVDESVLYVVPTSGIFTVSFNNQNNLCNVLNT